MILGFVFVFVIQLISNWIICSDCLSDLIEDQITDLINDLILDELLIEIQFNDLI